MGNAPYIADACQHDALDDVRMSKKEAENLQFKVGMMVLELKSSKGGRRE